MQPPTETGRRRTIARRIVAALAVALGATLVAGGVATARPEPSACTIVPEAPATFAAGDLQTFFVTTTGCATSTKPVRFKVVDGDLPPGMRLFTQGVSSAGITGRATTEGDYAFTLQARDATGTTDTESFLIVVTAPRPLVVSNPSDQLSPGVVGEPYCCGNLFADGGVPDYSWSLVGGALPEGLTLDSDAGRITGTPQTAGTSTFTVQVTDERGQTAVRTFSITVT